MVASCHVKDALSAMTMLFSFLEIKKKLKQAGNNWWLLKYKNEADKNAGVKEIGLVVLVNIGIRADSSQRDLTRSRAELNAVTHADHMKDDIVRGIDITNTFEQIVISENGKDEKYY